MAIPSLREQNDDPDVMVDINTTPLIDVMLVLLVTLIITIPIQTHSVKLNLPNGTPPPALTKPVVVTLDVAADGNLFWNGVRIENDATLEQKFKSVVGAGNETRDGAIAASRQCHRSSGRRMLNAPDTGRLDHQWLRNHSRSS